MLPGATFEEAETIISEEINRLKLELVPMDEIDKCVNKYESESLFSNLNQLERAYRIAQYEMYGDLDMINKEVDNYFKITNNDVQRLSNELFNENKCTTLYYGPDG